MASVWILAATACGGAQDAAPDAAHAGADASTSPNTDANTAMPDAAAPSDSGTHAAIPDAASDAAIPDAASDAAMTNDAALEDSGPIASGDCDGDTPGPDNTGVPAGTVLTPSGSITVEEEGAIVEDLDIDGTITVLADNVTIRRVRITTGDYYPVRYFDNDNVGLVIEDSEIAGTSGNATSGVAFANYTARRLNIHGTADGLKADSNVLIEDCFIHDLSNGDGEHNDGVQSTGGAGVTIRHNNISGASNACVQTGDEWAATEDLTIECNWLSGGGYTLNIRGVGDTRPRNTKIINNRFGRDSAYGPWTLDDPDPTIEGNVWDDNGEPIEE